MFINEFAEKFSVGKHEVKYWITLGLIHPKKSEYNGYQLFDEDNEQEIKKVIIMKAAGYKLDLPHLAFFRLIPDDMWEELVINKIYENRFTTMHLYDQAVEYAKEQ